LQYINPQNIIKLFSGNGNCKSFFNTLKSEVEPIVSEISLEKIDNLFKLLYKLFIYSIFGFVSKLLVKIFKF